MELNYQALLNRAQAILRDGGDLNEAKQILSALLTDHIDDPNHAFYLIYFVACTELKANNPGIAIALLRHAVSLKPDFVEAISNIGYTYKQLGRNEQSQENFEKLWPFINDKTLGLTDVERSEYITNIASTYAANGTPDKAIELCNQALELNPDNGNAKWNRGLAYLEKGDYEQGFRDFEYGERYNKYKHRLYGGVDVPYWDGTPGQTVVVFGEQGIGDEIMFASMLPDLIRDSKQVIIDAHIRLTDMFRDSFPGIAVYGTREGPDVPWSKHHQIDAKIPIGSLGKFYRKKLDDFPGTPYWQANPALVNKYKDKLNSISNKPKIGLSWQGGVVKTNKCHRKIPMELLLPLFKCDADFISLQYNEGMDKKVQEFNEHNGVTLYHWADTMADYDETAGLVCNLDLIISVPQSVVHLAGALGKKVVQLCPKRALWQMGPYGQDMPWYSCVKNIWQDETETWEPVINKAKEALCHSLQKNTDS